MTDMEDLIYSMNYQMSISRSDDTKKSRRSSDGCNRRIARNKLLDKSRYMLSDSLDDSDDELASLTKSKPRVKLVVDDLIGKCDYPIDYDDPYDLSSVKRKHMKRSRSELIFHKGLPENSSTRGTLRTVRSVHSLLGNQNNILEEEDDSDDDIKSIDISDAELNQIEEYSSSYSS